MDYLSVVVEKLQVPSPSPQAQAQSYSPGSRGKIVRSKNDVGQKELLETSALLLEGDTNEITWGRLGELLDWRGREIGQWVSTIADLGRMRACQTSPDSTNSPPLED